MAKAAVKFVPAEQEVHDLAASIIEKRFPEIAACDPPLQIAILFADNGGKVFRPALKHHGAACVAKISRVKPEEKAQGGPDVRISIDLNRWEERSDNGRAAILAHEIRHIKLKRERDGKTLKRDIYDRPAFVFVPDDWMLTGFRDVCEWYGEDAVEYQAVRDVHSVLVQLGLPFEGGGELTTAEAKARNSKPRKQRAAMVAAT